MISMAVLTATQKSRSFLEAAAGRKDLYLEEGPLEEGTLEIGTLGIGTLEKADVIYLPDYSSLDFRQVRELLKAGKHVLFGTMGAADAGSLKARHRQPMNMAQCCWITSILHLIHVWHH